MNSRREPSENLDTAHKSFDPSTAKVLSAGHEISPLTEAQVSIESPKKRPTTDAKEAARAFDRLEQLDADEARELAESPADIANRFAGKRERIIAELPEGVALLVQRMRVK